MREPSRRRVVERSAVTRHRKALGAVSEAMARIGLPSSAEFARCRLGLLGRSRPHGPVQPAMLCELVVWVLFASLRAFAIFRADGLESSDADPLRIRDRP